MSAVVRLPAAGAARSARRGRTARTDRSTDHTDRLARHGRTHVRSTEMNAFHEQLARQRWHEASTEAQRARLVRAFRAERRARRAERSARRATEVARRAADRVVLV
ncbi:MAG: hypothetical protein ACKVZ6_21445 [Kineosporiaceae bacterium]